MRIYYFIDRRKGTKRGNHNQKKGVCCAENDLDFAIIATCCWNFTSARNLREMGALHSGLMYLMEGG
jgi:hypothetical protein